MSDHEFERKVREKLDDLKLKPSAASWERLEGRLRERRRRAPWFWLPLLLAGLAAGGYFLFTPSGHKVSSVVSKKTSPRTIPAETVPSVPVPSAPAEEIPETRRELSAKDRGIEPVVSSPEPTHSDNNLAPGDNIVARSAGAHTTRKFPAEAKKPGQAKDRVDLTARKAAVTRSEESAPARAENHGDDKLDGNTDDRTDDKPLADPVNGVARNGEGRSGNDKSQQNNYSDKNRAADETVSSDKIAGKDGHVNENEMTKGSNIKAVTNVAESENTDVPESGAASDSQKKRKRKSGLKFGIRGYAGVSAVNEGNFLRFAPAVVEDVSFTPSFAPSALPTYKPSVLSSGIGYAGGVFAEKELSRRFSLSVGVNYLQLNTRMKVGQRGYGNQVVNSGPQGYLAVQSFYRVDQDPSTEYRNRYHFLELPVQAQLRINKSEKLPLYWNAGASVARLLKSNSLHFDGTTGVYYHNDDLLNRNQLAVNTGFAISVFNRSATPLRIGPSARYHVSRLMQKDLPAKKNFMSVGLEVKWYLK